jgi:hypothetical protein
MVVGLSICNIVQSCGTSMTLDAVPQRLKVSELSDWIAAVNRCATPRLRPLAIGPREVGHPALRAGTPRYRRSL